MAPGMEWCHTELLALAAVSLRFFGCSLQPCSRFGSGTRGTPLAVWDVLALDAAVLVVGASRALLFGSRGVVALHPGGTSTASPPCACSLQHSLPPGPAGRTGHAALSPAGTPADRFQPGFWLFLREPFIPNKEPRNHPAVKAFPWPYSGGDQRGAGRGRGPPEGSSQRGNSGGEPGVRPEEGAEGPGPGPSRAPPGAARSGGGPGRCGALRGSAGLPLPPLRPGPGPAPARNRMRPHPLPAALGAAPEEGERRGRPGAAPGTGTAPGAAPAG